jgi:hypothetical protein
MQGRGRDLVFILGSGRSGSSALTRILSLCDCVIPDKVLPGDKGNPRGFWEPVDATNLNSAFLERHHVALGDPTVCIDTDRVIDDVERENYIERIRSLLVEYPAGPRLIVKEPFINELTDFWFEAARREGFCIKVIIPLRSPQEYAASAAAFAGSSPVVASMVWLKLNLVAERKSRSLPRVFLEYTNLVKDWRSETAKIARTLPLALKPDEEAIDNFVTADLHRQRRNCPIQEAFGNRWISQTYEILLGASRDRPIDVSSLDEIYGAYRACALAFREFVEWSSDKEAGQRVRTY